ncbi:cation-transporting P-type ATPase [Erysipelotrichaceae bacterium]|nr:cation-transporting P-type ATPase [Erysipelotrichaceae bacterium]
MREIFEIEGMTCATCSGRIEKVVGKMAGVERVVVNLISEKMQVEYDDTILDATTICKKVEAIGFKAVKSEGSTHKNEKPQTLKIKLMIALIFAIPLFYIAMAPMIEFISLPFPAYLDPHHEPLRYALVELALTIPILCVGYEFYLIGFKSLFKGSPNMDSLIAIGTSAAVAYSLYSTFEIIGGSHMAAMEGLYYETAGIIITLILLGRFLEQRSKAKTSQAIKKLLELAPKSATVLENGVMIEVPIAEVCVGQVVVVKPGEKIPVDGRVIQGKTLIDEAMLTGESMPVSKKIADAVYAATLNKNGSIHIEATQVGENTALAQIIRLVEDAQATKAPIAKLADIVSGYFVPIVCVIAIISGIGWYFGTGDFAFALRIFISVLVIACPCALGLATPTAIMVGTGLGAENGILFKSGAAVERAQEITAIIFDKTGTITAGKPAVTDILPTQSFSEKRLLTLVASAEASSEHPLGEAIVNAARDQDIGLLAIKEFTALPGLGICVQSSEGEILVGNALLMSKNTIDFRGFEAQANTLATLGKTPMYVAVSGVFAGLVAVADVIRPSSKKAIASLQSRGLELYMITGDNLNTAKAIAAEVGITNVIADVLPEDKAKEVSRLQKEGKIVAMVGDGINDAPALATADVGIAIGTGTDVALESADIVLMKSDLQDVTRAIVLSNATIKNIKQNLFWAFSYNILGIPIAAGLLYLFGGPLLNPVVAATAMACSSVSVLANALRLKKVKLTI